MRNKIGIRPIIDGRWGGIRESLEEQTVNMANAAAKLISENVFYADGVPAEVVISPCTIGGSAEAARCAEFFKENNVMATLSVTPCWCYGSETMDIDPNTLKAVWGFNGTERPGAVYLAAVMSAHAQRGLPAFSIYGRDVQDLGMDGITPDVREKLLRFARCALAVGQMYGKSYVNIGSVAMGIAGSECNAIMLQKYFGLRTEWVDMSEVQRRVDLEIYDKAEYEKELTWIRMNCRKGDDFNKKPFSDAQKEKQWEFVAKMTLIIKDIMLGNDKLNDIGRHEEALGRNAILGGFQGQRMWTDNKPNGDFSEAILNSTFDWNGKRPPVTVATENDVCNGLSMLLGSLVTHRAAVFADVRTYWSPESVQRVTGWKPNGKAENGFIHLINSGAAAIDATGVCVDNDGNPIMKRWWEVDDKDIAAMMSAVKWAPASNDYFRGGGFSSQLKTLTEMPVTLIRVNLVDGIGYTLQLAEGYTAVIPENVDNTLLMRTDPSWPSTWFAPRIGANNAFKDVYNVMANWGANHGAFVYGHIGKDLITLASMLRIPVSMHNIDEANIYRPHCFTAFGTKDTEAADFRACNHYGPLYK